MTKSTDLFKEDSIKNIKNQVEFLEQISNKFNETQKNFNKPQHDSESRIKITILFLKWFFFLIVFSFIFSALYNFIASNLNMELSENSQIPLLDVANTVSIITTTLSSGVGFVIGYYFKNKEN